MTTGKVYGTRGVANPHNHEVYSFFLSQLGLLGGDESELIKRGLTHAQIRNGKYATKGNNKDKQTYNALAQTNASFDLDEVPGFYIDDKTGHRTMVHVSGLVIPVCDYNGHYKSLLIKNDRAKLDKRGKLANKYVTVSSSGKTKGGRVYHTTHCPIVKGLPKEVCGTTARMTEGVLKADIATALGKYYCMGTQGLNLHEDFEITLEALEVSLLLISFDQGEDDSFDMIRGKARMIKRVKELGIDFKVEIWDKKLGKGIDDVIKGGHEEKIEYMTDEAIDELMRAAKEVDPFSGDWIYVIDEEKVYNTKTFKAWKKQQFADQMGLVKAEEISRLIAERKLDFVERTTYWPGKGLFVEEDEYRCLNVWKKSEMIPLEGDVTTFTNFINYLIPDEVERKLTLQWISWCIQNQGDKLMFSLMIIGTQGVGKSLLLRMITELVGRKNVAIPTTEQLLENFNGYLLNKSLIICEEVMARGRQDIHNKVKPWITEETVMIRKMNKDAFEAKNRFNCMWLSNFIDAVPIDDEDRRFLMASAAEIKQTDEFYRNIVNWMNNPVNMQHLLYHLQKIDLSDFNAKGRAPITKTKDKAIKSNLNQLEEFVFNRIADSAYPFNGELCTVRHLRDKRVCSPGLERFSDFKWAAALKKAGAIAIDKQVVLSDKSKVKLWAYGPRKHILSNPDNTTTEMLREMFEKNLLDVEPGNPIVDALDHM